MDHYICFGYTPYSTRNQSSEHIRDDILHKDYQYIPVSTDKPLLRFVLGTLHLSRTDWDYMVLMVHELNLVVASTE